MLKRTSLSSLIAASYFTLVGLSGSAQAQHDMRAFVSPDGLNKISEVAPKFVPEELNLSTVDAAFACMDFQQRDTTINLEILDLDLYSPQSGTLRVELDVAASGSGELYADDIYACLGELTCQDSFQLDRAHVAFDLEIEVFNGVAEVITRNSEVDIERSDFNIDLDDCGFTGEVLEGGIDALNFAIVAALEGAIASAAEESIGPMVQDLLDGFRSEGSIGVAEYAVDLSDVDIFNGGVALGLGADLIDRFDAHSCVAEYDEGGPNDFAGGAPNISGSDADHANLAINLGLLNKAFYTVWRRGLLCLGDQQLAALGVDFSLETVAAMLPGFPPGTELEMDLILRDYPRVIPSTSDAGELTLMINSLAIELRGTRPDGLEKTLVVEIDAQAELRIAVAPGTNAIVAQILGADITRMLLEDERSATDAGFDVGRILQLAEDVLLPNMLGEMGAIPLTGPVFAFDSFATILRNLSTNDAYLRLGLDLFPIPDDDTTAPDTQLVSYPQGRVNPKTAIVKMGGSDSQIPVELLQYQVHVDGVELAPNFMRELKVGEVGVSAVYQVEVAAVDLSGNVDPTPEIITVDVDGISPSVVVLGERKRDGTTGVQNISWRMDDDLSAAGAMDVRVEIYKIDDPSDALTTRLIDTQNLQAGALSTTVDLSSGEGVYRVEVHVTDEAGNESLSSLLLTLPEGTACGCSSSAPGASGNLALILLALAGLLRRRRILG